jgi:hypothetical protein
LVIVMLLLAAACTRRNPEVCCTTPDDCSSIGFDSQQPCKDGLICVEHSCTTGCAIDDDCATPTPFCAADHACVECISSDQCTTSAPTCDDATRLCRACATDADCASTLCDAEMGTCVDEATVLYASPTGGATASCDKGDPCSIVHAFELAATPRDTVKLATGSYIASLTITGKTVVVYGFGATVTAATAGGAFNVGDTAHLRLIGLAVIDSNPTSGEAAVLCRPNTASTARLELDQVVIDAAATPVAAIACSLTVSRSHLLARGSAFTCFASGTAQIDRSTLEGGDGIRAEGAAALVHVVNSVFQNQTGPDGAFLGAKVPVGTGGFGSMFVSFSTVINSPVICGAGEPACAGGTVGGSCVDNSIILNGKSGAPPDTVTGSACFLNYTLVFPQATSLVGIGNQFGVDPLLVDPASGDFHLRSGSPSIDAADPTSSNTIDFDGTLRPQGARDDLGAFELKP